MKKRLFALGLTVLIVATIVLTAFAVEPLSSDEAIAQKRAWYPLIRDCEENLYKKEQSLQNISIDRIIVVSDKHLISESDVQAEAKRDVFTSTITIFIHFTALEDETPSGYVFVCRPQNNFFNLYNDSSSSMDVSNYKSAGSLLAGNINPSVCTFLENEYLYSSIFGGVYYIGVDVVDYQNYISSQSVPVTESPTAQDTGLESEEVPTEQYTKDQELVISGKVDFDYFYTYKDTLSYKCFSLTKNGKRFYASVREDLYNYYKNAFKNHSLTLKGKYQFTAGDGSPVVEVSTLVEGTKETNLRSYLWTLNKGSSKNPNFKAYADLKGDGLILSAAKDGQSITIDSNPWGASKGSQAYQLSNDLALLYIKELNSEFGLPDWLYTEMVSTRAVDGRQKEVFDYITVTWSYHPDSGINILYRKNN